jgi:UDP-2,4-diacetamido-2,4,6-trideoxy-beta-L-altropyranose hydrolase
VKKKLAIKLDAGPERGMGHLYRQLHLGKILQEHGFSPQYFIPEYAPAIEILKRENLPYHITKIEEAWPSNWPTSFEIVILDRLDTTSEFIAQVRSKAKYIVDFEDLGPGRNHVDLLIDANLTEKTSAPTPSSVRTLFGLENIALHTSFAQISRTADRAFSLEPVLISMGGVDPLNVTQKTVQMLKSLQPDLDITVIVGSGYPWYTRMESLQEALNFKLERDISNMAERLSQSGSAFCSGGIIMHEAIAAGAIPLVVSMAEHQTRKALYAQEKGAALFLGVVEKFNESDVAKALKLTSGQLKQMHEAGRKLIDGKGIFRVVSAIEAMT